MGTIQKVRTGGVGLAMLFFALLTPQSLQSAEPPESDDPIHIAVLDWSQQQVMAHIAGTLLEDLGYNVEYVSTTFGAPSNLGIAEGDLTFMI